MKLTFLAWSTQKHNKIHNLTLKDSTHSFNQLCGNQLSSNPILETQETDQNVINELNSKKRKLLDPTIYESFTHPKKIKTESLILSIPKTPKINKEVISTSKKQSNALKHKFKFE